MLKTVKNSNYLYEVRDGKTSPFFWLGDTAWLLLQKLSLADAEVYFENRSERRYNVVQAVLAHDENFEDGGVCVDFDSPDGAEEYWDKAEAVTALAEKYGIYMAWLPVWGSMVKKGYLNERNAGSYAGFLAKRLGGHENVIWVMGGDIRGSVGFDVWNTMGSVLRRETPDKLITFHPFGRTCSADWFSETDLLDFNMFQSGHRRYDQASLGAWDDNKENENFCGEDNWRYVERCLSMPNPKPTLDGEPSYEHIHQGLHNFTQPLWKAADVRRYAYWSVFQGACGHTYGCNSVMQFYSPGDKSCSYDAKEYWTEGIKLPGGEQMKYLIELMTSVDFSAGRHNDELVSNEGFGRYDRVTAFSGGSFAYIYNFSGRGFRVNLGALEFKPREAVWFDPSSGVYTETDVDFGGIIAPPRCSDGGSDMVLTLK